GDERPRDETRQCALPVDARRHRSEETNGGRADQRLARARGARPLRGRTLAGARVRARARPRGGLRMRVCVVGCGAVGSLFAANLAQLEDVEVWAYDLARDHVNAINAKGLRLSGAGEVVGHVR